MITLDISHVNDMYISLEFFEKILTFNEHRFHSSISKNALARLIAKPKVKLRLCAFDDICSKKLIFAYNVLSSRALQQNRFSHLLNKDQMQTSF